MTATPSPAELAAMRRSYVAPPFVEEHADPDPFNQFMAWFSEAKMRDPGEANAMTLATATPDGKPAARVVLLKGFSEQGLVFYSHRTSQKGQHLADNPHAEALFYWNTLYRQARIAGPVTELPPETVQAYFQSRPRDSQLGAWASPQSETIPHREVLNDHFAAAEQRFADHEKLPVPPNWTGYRLTPESFEFWQGQPNRLHDRLRYLPNDDHTGWHIDRLAP